MAKKQGDYDKEDESIGMRLGKGKATKKDKKKAKKERDESYGKWGKRSKDWKTAKTGSMIKAKRGKKILKAAALAGAAYLGSKHLGKMGMKGNVSKTAAMEDANIGSNLVDAADAGTKFKKASKAKTVYSDFWGGAKSGAMIKAKGSVFVKTKIGRNKRTLTF
jgi:hypothetical protein